MTYTFPPEAMPVVEYIRKHVPRPKELPRHDVADKNGGVIGCLRFKFGSCPLGLCPGATELAPVNSGQAGMMIDGVISLQQIRSFYETWDSFTDPVAAMNALWPEGGE